MCRKGLHRMAESRQTYGPGRSYCKECKKDRQDKVNKERGHRPFQRKYGATTEEIESMFKQQSGKCAICGGQSSAGRRLSIDHDHETGQIRGLLCDKCNRGLGLFGDSPELMREAAAYLAFKQEYT